MVINSLITAQIYIVSDIISDTNDNKNDKKAITIT